MTLALSDVVVNIFALGLTYSPLYLFAGLGEIIGEKSGVVNLGIEGVMIASLLTMDIVDLFVGPWLGILAALAVAAVVGLAFAYLSVYLRLEQIVLGLAIFFFFLGLSSQIWNTTSLPQVAFSGLGTIYIPVLSDIPLAGKVLFQQNILFYFSIILVVLVSYFLQKTSFGLRVRAVGENPKAADNMGVNVQKVRFLAVLVGAIFMGLGGAYFSLYFVSSFNYDPLQGKGFIVLAMIYLANWGPYKTLFAAVSFNIVAVASSVYVALSPAAQGGTAALYAMLPFVYLLALIPILGRGARPPRFLLKPYRKG